MTEALHNSSDVPNFDNYPSSYPSGRPELRVATGPSDNSGSVALAQHARQIGAALGTAVSTLRNAQEKIRELGGETAESAVTHFNDLAQTAKTKVHELGQATAARALELGEAVAQKAEELGERARAGYHQARQRADHISREHPEHVLLAAAALGVLLGIGIRIWRANRAN